MTDIPFVLSFFNWVENKSKSKYYIHVLVVLACVLTCPFHVPYVYQESLWDAVILKSQDLTNTLSQFDSASHQAKMVFRLTIPVIMKIFHLNSLAIQFIQYILGYLLIIFLYKL